MAEWGCSFAPLFVCFEYRTGQKSDQLVENSMKEEILN